MVSSSAAAAAAAASSSPSPSPPVPYSKIASSASSSPALNAHGKPGEGFHIDHSASAASKLFSCSSYGDASRLAAAAFTGIIAFCLLLLLALHVRHHHSSPPVVQNPFGDSALPPSPSPSPWPSTPWISAPVPSPSPSSETLGFLCNGTDSPALCYETLFAAFPSEVPSLPEMTAVVTSEALRQVNGSYALAANLSKGEDAQGGMAREVLQDCQELLDGAKDELRNSVDRLMQLRGDEHDAGSPAFKSRVMDVRAWLSTAYTDQDTCFEEFSDYHVTGPVKGRMIEQGRNIGPLIAIAMSFAETLQVNGTYYIHHQALPSPVSPP